MDPFHARDDSRGADGGLDGVELRDAIRSSTCDVPQSLSRRAGGGAEPGHTWADKQAYDLQAANLARMFADNFKTFEGSVSPDVDRRGPPRMNYEAVIGLEIHAQLQTATEDLLRLQHGVRRAAERARLSRLPRVSRARCRC